MSGLLLDESHQGFDAGRLARVSEILEAGVKNGVYPGAVAAISHAGRLVYLRAVGRQQDAPEVRPIMPTDAIFDLASITKPVATGTALMLLIEDGLLTLDDPVFEHIPAFATPDKAHIRIRHLVSHTSGVQSNPKLYYEHKSWATLLPAYLALPLIGAPGSLFLYSSINFIILSQIIEKVAGKSLDRLLQERVFGPLGMRDTLFNPPQSLRARIPATEFIEWRESYDWGVVNDKTAQMMGGVSGHAGLFSSARDLSLFGSVLLNGGVHEGVRIFSPAGARKLIGLWIDERGVRRGLCWLPASPKTFGDLLGANAIGHTGTAGTAMCISPDDGLVITLLTNRVHPSRDNDKIERFRPLFFNAACAARTIG